MKPVKATVGAIIEKDGNILMELRNNEPFKNHWCIPGGHIDFGEQVETAVTREVKEETGLTADTYSFFNYYTEYYPEMDWHAVALVFSVTVSGKEKMQESEVKELRWFSYDEVLSLSLAFEHERILTDYIIIKKTQDT